LPVLNYNKSQTTKQEVIMSSRKVVFPNELLVNKQVETTIFTEKNDIFGIAVLSEEGEDSTLILRIYQLMWFDDEQAYSPVQELEALSFQTREQLDDFVTRLPDITGLEMLMLINPLPAMQ